MCGVVGFVSRERKANLIKEFVKKVEHRGPDNLDSKIIAVNNKFLHLGSARLSIRGGKSENMPMVSKMNNFIIYNGEIFDTKFLYSKLDSPISYISDTRMVLDLLDGDINNVSHLNGMFAFAYFDSINEKLYLCRDKLGIKPLFYIIKNDEIYFSSEIKSLIDTSNVSLEVSQDSVSKIFLFNGLKVDHNLGGIKSVKPGELIEFDLKKNTTSSRIFKIENANSDLDLDFNELFKLVISDHLEADTPVDLFLSGGIDSSLIALTVKKELNREVRHFSLAFEDLSYDESELIKRIASDLNLDSLIFKFEKKNIDSYVSEAIQNMNSLVLDYSFIPTYILSKLSSKHTKAVLSGDGADELFGGYEWYRGIYYYNLLPFSLKKYIFNLVRSLDLNGQNYGYSTIYDKINLFFKYISNDPYVQMLIWQSPYSNFQKKDADIISNEIQAIVSENNLISENLRNIDLNNYLYSNILPKVDTASMANSLEVRPPFLDERIVKFALSNKNTNKIKFNTKQFLKNHLKNTNLSYLNNYKKHGFGFPVAWWLKNYGLEEIRQMYKDNSLIYLDKDKQHVNNLVNKKNININEYRELWSYYIVSKWFKNNNIKVT